MTTTQARYLRNGTTDLSSELPGTMDRFFNQYNADSTPPVEPTFHDILGHNYLQESESSESESEIEEVPQDEVTVLWRVEPDLGEDDHSATLYREFDTANGAKFHGWTNPLGWTDGGDDDDRVVLQLKSKVRYDESGFPTPADNGLDDDQVLNLLQTNSKINMKGKYAESEGPTKVDFGEADHTATVYREFDVANGAKFHGWTNPLGWTDGGDDDESVL